jgi:mannose-1-phosphate guanylyltransferase / mannose-6-phosphate isomerase
MQQTNIIPIILSGGAGTRLWPLSRNAKPKQFLRFGTEHSLLQETLLRCSGELFDTKPIVVSGDAQRFLIAEDLRELAIKADIVLEPMRRDSCAAIAAGCLQALKRSQDALVFVLAADHKIPDHNAFSKAVQVAVQDAQAGYLTTFGIKPTYAATAYGYIKPGPVLRDGGSAKLEKFVEKPDAITAAKYLDDGYLWNSGNFLFSAKVFLTELEKSAPQILAAVQASFSRARFETDFIWLEKEAFSRSPQISVDYAVLEKTDRAAVLAVDYSWSDIGSWDAVHDLLPHDAHQNAVVGHGLVLNGANNLVHSNTLLTALIGVDDLAVVVSDDAILVTKRGHSENVKILVAELQARKFKEAD